jgi:hypothetical protein
MSGHSLHVHRANTPGNKTATGAENLDRFDVRQMRWAYRQMRRHGVPRSTARVLHMTMFSNGFLAGLRHDSSKGRAA